MSAASLGSDHARGLGRAAALSLVARFAAMACSSVTALLVANALTRSDYGAYAVVVGINVVLVMALDLGLTSSLARYVAQGRASTALVVRVALLRLAVIGVAALVVLVSPVVPAVDRSALAPLLPMLAALVVVQSTIAFHFGSLPALRRIRLLALVTVAQPVAELALVLVVRARGGDAADMLTATVASAGGVSVLAWLLLLLPGRAAAPELPHPGPEGSVGVAQVAEYGRRIFLVSLLIAVFGQVDQFVIGFFHPLSEVAPYALVLKLQALVAAPAITIAGIVAPRIAGAGTAALALYRRWLAFLVVLELGAVLVLAALAPQAFGTIGAQYREEWPLLVAMAPFLLLGAVAPLPSIALNQTGHATSRLRIAAIAVAINLVLDLALVPPLGAWGAAIATTVAFGYYLVRHHLLLECFLGGEGPSLARLLAPAAPVAVLVALGALGIRIALDAVADPGDAVGFLVPALVAAVVHAAYSSRLVRGGE